MSDQDKYKEEETKQLVYTLGSPDPRFVAKRTVVIRDVSGRDQDEAVSRSYSSFSGVDIKVYMQGDDEEVCIGEAQAISLERDLETDKCRGSLVTIIFDDDALTKFFKKTVTITLRAANEHGAKAICVIDNVRFKIRRWGISIDDLVLEQTADFEGWTEGWKKHEE
jgi:hypothetical protein